MKHFDKNIVVMLPYPSNSSLHLGHFYNYALMDSYCRWLRFQGETVNQPFGFDAFGLPAENYARSIGGDPAQVTDDNIERFKIQMSRMNTEFDIRFSTTDPSFIKWTQWVFLKMKERGLAYKAVGVVNWCDSCQTVLANEQAKGGVCDRCKSSVTPGCMDQWYFKITDYRDRLIANLDKLDYPAKTIKMQREWLRNQRDWCVSRQRKWGCPIPIEGEADTLDTFVDSSFYFLRYLTNSNEEFLPAGSYRPVDLYVGGSEHACMHLIYARFVHMVLFDMGIVPEEEPFRKVIHQGMVTRGGEKMAKSTGNAICPDGFDPDELRMYLMFLGHYFDGGEWDDRAIVGVRRFFAKMKKWLSEPGDDDIDLEILRENLDNQVRYFRFNKVVSGWMEFYNRSKTLKIKPESIEKITEMLRVFAPGFRVATTE